MGIERNLVAHRGAGDAEEVANAKIALDQHSNCIATKAFHELAGGCAGATLEFEADHSGTAAHVTLCDGSRVCVLHSRVCVFRLHVETIDVVQVAIPSFRNNWKRPPVLDWNRGSVFQLPVDNGVAHNAHAVRIGDHHGAVKKAGFLDPCGAGHLAVAVLGEPSCKYGIHGGFASGENCCDTGTNRSDAHLQLSFAADQGAIPDLDSFDVCN